MSFLDKFKKKAGEAASQHGGKITQGLDKAGEAARRRTNGKYDDKINKGLGKAKEGLHRLGDKKDGPHDGPHGGNPGGTPGGTPGR